MLRVSLFSLAALLVTTAAAAQPDAPALPEPGAALDPASTPSSAPGVHLVDDSEPKPPLIPRTADVLGGHLLVGASAGAAWSLGDLSSDVSAARGLGTGIAFNADLGFGVSRSVALGAWGELARYGDGSGCNDCSGSALAVGPFVRYHLSQGLRFDPWVLAGAGYRQVSFESAVGTQRYSGVQWLRLELGADYYAWSGAGLGPYLSLSLSSYGSRPVQDTGDASLNTELGAGLRLLFDLPGR